MVYVFTVLSPVLSCGTPASILDGEEWTFTDTSLKSATKRALRRLDSTFALATRTRIEATSLRHTATFESLSAYQKASDAARESGVSLEGISLLDQDADEVFLLLNAAGVR